MTNLKNNFFFISFFPAIAYWYLETRYPVKIAVIGGLTLAILEILLERFFTKSVHTFSKLNFFLILGLGSVALFFQEGIWFKLQPLFTGVVLSSLLVYKLKTKNGLLLEMISEMNKPTAPDFIIKRLEWHLAIFLLLYGVFMGILAVYFSTDTWAFFKTAGFYIVFVIFAIFEIFAMRYSIKKFMQNQQKAQILRRLK